MLESPALLVAALVAGGVALPVVMRTSNRARMGLVVGAAMVVAGVALAAAAALIETERERVDRALRGLVQATATVNLAGMDRLLAEDVRLLGGASLDGLRVPAGGLDKAGIVSRVAEVLGTRFPLDSAKVVEAQVQVTGLNVARAQTHIRVTLAGWGVPYNSWWSLEWRRDGDAWRAISIAPVSLDR
ncbi:MAG: nuclear transport factor 2 family protein [Phycisphaerales bacterium]|nr:nuclear transport factor 2 family protein [Phycisphaerales bacterium]